LGENSELLVEKLFENSLIPAKIFSIKYENVLGSTYIYFGGYETNMMTSDIVYLPIDADHEFWSIEFTHVQFEGYNKILNPSSGAKALLDTGTTLTYFIPSMYDKVLANFKRIDSSC